MTTPTQLPPCYRCGKQPCECGATLYCGDCIELMDDMPRDSVDLVFGSPPYEDARTYEIDFQLKEQEWVDWMVKVVRASLRVSRGLVAFVVEGRTRQFQYSATPSLLEADLHRAGICLRKPLVFGRHGIPGGSPDFPRSDWERVIACTNGGRLPWVDLKVMGHPCKYPTGGAMSYRTQDGRRINERKHLNGSAAKGSKKRRGRPEITKPGDVLWLKVGKGHMGNDLAHENEAPFPEDLAEFFVRTFCPPGGIVLDPFSGSGTTVDVARQHGRRGIGIDLRESQIELAANRLRQECLF